MHQTEGLRFKYLPLSNDFSVIQYIFF